MEPEPIPQLLAEVLSLIDELIATLTTDEYLEAKRQEITRRAEQPDLDL